MRIIERDILVSCGQETTWDLKEYKKSFKGKTVNFVEQYFTRLQGHKNKFGFFFLIKCLKDKYRIY